MAGLFPKLCIPPDEPVPDKCYCCVSGQRSCPGIEMESYVSNITRHWKPMDTCRNIHTNMISEPVQDGSEPNMIDMPAMDDHESTNLIDTELKAKVTPRPGGSTNSQGGNRPTSGRSSGSSEHGSVLRTIMASAMLAATSSIVNRLI
ncbi:AAEL006695-PA [Aedes aegypti]|uniref:AAEL006695-PA n=1 Tax=Aedes aegypti TaxID=7159 RepID=Q175E5_AEDAE|nr:AAEL006695-PA [Aedes aegypti]